MYNKVKAIADKQGISIASLEKQAGLANGTIGKWKESDKGVRASSIVAIAKILKVPVEDLMEE